jgi:hypothetical protein
MIYGRVICRFYCILFRNIDGAHFFCLTPPITARPFCVSRVFHRCGFYTGITLNCPQKAKNNSHFETIGLTGKYLAAVDKIF